MGKAPRASRLIGWVVDAAPWVLFVAAFLVTFDLRRATMFLVPAAATALVLGPAIHKKIRPLPTISWTLVVLFGGLSLILNDPQILKMKMTILDGSLGAALFIGIALKKNPLKFILGGTVPLSDKAWNTLAIRYGLFWWASAAANEVVRRTQTDQMWVWFKIAAVAAGILFAVVQIPFLIKHGAVGDGAEVPPTDPGV